MILVEQVMNGGAVLQNGIVVRRAVIPDYRGIEELVNKHKFQTAEWKKVGALILLSYKEIADLIWDGAFYVADAAGPFEVGEEAYAVPRKIVACGGFVEYDGIPEVRSFVTDEQYRGNGLQTLILQAVLESVRQKSYDRVYTLANPDAVGFFQKNGFVESDIPFAKQSRDCAICPVYDLCDEVALVRYL